MTYEEWYAKIKELIIDIHITEAHLNVDLLKNYWKNGYAPAVAIHAMFPEYWRF